MKRLKMKLIKVKITPHSSFVTFPKGDTIFGHFAYHTFLKGEDTFKNYINEEPKIIFSDILPDGYLYKPTLPLKAFGIDESEKKAFRKKTWIAIDDLQNGDLTKVHSSFTICTEKECNDSLSDKDRKKCCIPFFKTEIRVRNSLNRVTFSTDDSGEFAPFSLEELTFTYQPVVYVQYDEDCFNEITIVERLNLIGKVGFGKKGSIGKGHFSAELDSEFKGFDEVKSKFYLTLSPTILNKQPHITKAYYNTFNRFGKSHSSATPFKKPLLMADSGAVVKLEEHRTYIGRGIENGINQQSLVQGYSIVVPFKFDGKGL
jgi:CRISPR-associated protein Csm4